MEEYVLTNAQSSIPFSLFYIHGVENVQTFARLLSVHHTQYTHHHHHHHHHHHRRAAAAAVVRIHQIRCKYFLRSERI